MTHHKTCSLGLRCKLMAVALALLPAIARGHAVLVESSPKQDEVLKQAPREAVLRFDARIEKKVTRATLVDGDGKKVKLPPIPEDKDGPPERLVIALPELKPGAYRLEYRVLASDGHATPGLIKFSIAGPETRKSGGAAK